MISFNSGRGERLITLQIVRNSVVHASLWKTITIDVVGSLLEYVFVRQLEKGENSYW